jgi:hypothetical protein
VNCIQQLCIELSVINFHCEIEPANLLQYHDIRVFPGHVCCAELSCEYSVSEAELYSGKSM